jgi:hypothetical protein
MTIWRVLKQFNYKQLWQLFVLALKYPIYIYPTLKATVKSFQISKGEFPKTHGKKGKGNAFRHALWNLLICNECLKWRKDKSRVVAWAKIITDKHEELSPNNVLDKVMDLHNNEVGRGLFQEFQLKNINKTIEKLKIKLNSSKKIEDPNDVNNFSGDLIYIKE